ncbi:suppressor of mec-8 and unc-52 protein homolog 2-like [Camellia sinensis]|uniref:suppressor of mec-8 and unc-52 protein homolog 2-like n=1 Tax=Camellia sinensis TaxID=4442 RepID=UPI0010364909|nr:suppressor of mec-8 and unc-52 protein homolog 2-like [Camellia sinensis]
MVTVSVDGSVLDRIAKIMSYLRLGSSGKVLKKKKKEREVKGRIAIIGNDYVEDERVSKPDGEILKNRTYRENLPPPPPPPKQGHPESRENQGPEVSRAEDDDIFVGEILLPAL